MQRFFKKLQVPLVSWREASTSFFVVGSPFNPVIFNIFLTVLSCEWIGCWVSAQGTTINLNLLLPIADAFISYKIIRFFSQSVGSFLYIQYLTSTVKNLFLSQIPHFVNEKASCLTKAIQLVFPLSLSHIYTPSCIYTWDNVHKEYKMLFLVSLGHWEFSWLFHFFFF